jgi:hypothetical protein
MKTNGKHEVIARIAWQSLVLVALFAIVLSVASISSAQSRATSSATSPAMPAASPAKAPASPAEKAPAKGQHEGIAVHGHWTIDVKNPDGKIVTHREFENAIDPNEGADLLTGVLSGEYSPSGFYIALLGMNSGTLCANLGECILQDSRDLLLPELFSAFPFFNGTVTYTPNVGSKNAIGFTLSGSSTPPSGGTISAVVSGVYVCMSAAAFVAQNIDQSDTANAANSTQFAALPPGQAGISPGTSTGLGGISQGCLANRGSTILAAPLNLTSAGVNPGVVVTFPQTVSVTVAITFGSGAS